MKEKKVFSDYINRIRRKKQISMSSLCDGLCSIQDIYNIENDNLKPEILLQEAILERLGIGEEDYEHFLFYDEYKRWLDRHHILHSITMENFDEADCLLEKYYETYVHNGDKYKLESQFYLSMLAQVKRRKGESKEVLHKIFDEAIRITVPMYETKHISDMVLSIKEINLILEAERHREEGERIERYTEIVDYITKMEFDSWGKVKIYPKAVYFLCRCMKEEAEGRGELSKNRIREILKYCSSAKEILRNSGKMYFLWEILCMGEVLMEEYMQDWTDGNNRKNNRLNDEMNGEMNDRKDDIENDGKDDKKEDELDVSKSALNEIVAWRWVLENVYEKYDVPKETFEYCYIYVSKGVSCINDVIRIRREMFGMSQKELCEGICSVKTLRRLENYKTSTHRAIVYELFEKLGMSGELTRTEIATSSHEARELMEKIRRLGNDEQLEEAEKLLFCLKKIVFMDISINRQVLMRQEALIHRKKKIITNKEYYEKTKKALEVTLPYKYFLQEGDKYLTNEEQSCIQNMMKVMDENSEELLICIRHFEKIYQFYIDNGLQETVFGMYEFVMGRIGSILGNRGEFDNADKYNRQIIEGCLRFRRLTALQNGLYDRWWNNSERKKRNIPIEEDMNDEEELTACLLISRLCRLNYGEQFYRKKLEMIRNK